MCKLRTALGKFGEFWALIAYFWLAWVRQNHFVKTNFSKPSKEIADPSYVFCKTTLCLHSGQLAEVSHPRVYFFSISVKTLHLNLGLH